MKLIAEGHSGREIGELGHRGNILQKLGLRNRVDLVRFVIRAGLAEA